MACRYVFCSISFSVPRCKSPMCGSTRLTTSPSSSSTRRRTPCAAGCCGPKFRLKLRIWASVMSGFPILGDHCHHFGASHLPGVIGKRIVLRLFLDEDFGRQPQAFADFHGRSRDRIHRVIVRAPEQRRATFLAEAALCPVGGAIHTEGVILRDVHVFAMQGHERAGRPPATHRTMADADVKIVRRNREGHPAAKTLRGNRFRRCAHLDPSRYAGPSFAFSSPGSRYSTPSHGLRKSKLRNSCVSRTGS